MSPHLTDDGWQQPTRRTTNPHTTPRRNHMATTWLTTAQAAEALAMHPETVRRLLRRGDLSAKRTPGGRYKIAAHDIDTYMRRMEDAA